MTTHSAPLHIQARGGRAEGAGALPQHDLAGASGDAGEFRAAFLRLAGGPSGAIPAPTAQHPHAQTQIARPDNGQDPNRQGDEDEPRSRLGEQAGPNAPDIPLTIDALNAMLLVGGGRVNAGEVARGALRSQAGGSTGEADGPAAELSAHARRADRISARPADPPRPDASSPEARPHAGPAAAADQRSSSARGNSDNSTANDRAQPDRAADRARSTPTPSPSSHDFLRTLAARGLTSTPAPSSAQPGGGSGNSPFVLRPLAAGRGAAPAAPKSPAPPATAARQEAFAAQMSRILTTAAAKGGGTMTMRLAPEALGALTVRVGVEGGEVSARFEAESAAARDLLNQTLSALRSSLEAKGLSVQRLQVELAAPEPPRAPEDQGHAGEPGRTLDSDPGGGGERSGGEEGGGRAAERSAAASGGDGAEASIAEASDDRTDAIAGADPRPGDVFYLGLDAVG